MTLPLSSTCAPGGSEVISMPAAGVAALPGRPAVGPSGDLGASWAPLSGMSNGRFGGGGGGVPGSKGFTGVRWLSGTRASAWADLTGGTAESRGAPAAASIFAGAAGSAAAALGAISGAAAGAIGDGPPGLLADAALAASPKP